MARAHTRAPTRPACLGTRGVGSPSVMGLPGFDVGADVTRRNDFFLGFFRIRTAAVACILRCSLRWHSETVAP